MPQAPSVSPSGLAVVRRLPGEQLDALNRAIQDTRRDLGHLDERTAVPIAGGETAGPGDVLVTRRTDRTLRTDHDEPVRNRELWRVEHVDADGSFTVSRERGQGPVTIPADYARQHRAPSRPGPELGIGLCARARAPGEVGEVVHHVDHVDAI